MNRTDQFSQIRDIADAICHEEVTPEQIATLEALLTNNPEGQKFYTQYIALHVQMQESMHPQMEVIRRKIQMEEVIVRPSSRGVLSHEQPVADIAAPDVSVGDITPPVQPLLSSAKPAKQIGPWQIISLTILLVLVALLYVAFSSSDDNLGKIIEGRLSVNSQGEINDNHIQAGEYTSEQRSSLTLTSGEQLTLEKGTQFKLFNNKEIQLIEGKLSVASVTEHNLIVHGHRYTLHTNGSPLTVETHTEHTKVLTGERTLLYPKRWRPKHYWSFDDKGDRAQDFAGNAHGVAEQGTARVKGLLGQGAFYFDDQGHARVNVGSGGGTTPATGSFAATDGVTIEALIQPEYSGEFGDHDLIFRKDQSDRELRLLLGFQNDRGKDYLMPDGIYEESLSFGLFILGEGYQELKLPLDGKEGRPTLADLKTGSTHHVVASYDVKTGLKAIYIDGELMAHHQYPAGARMLSGGPGAANIGNTPNPLIYKAAASEPFNGIIDEVAFYDFALPDWVVKQHAEFTQQGLNYFGLQPKAQNLPQQISITLPANATVILAPLTGLPKSYSVN